MLQLRLRIAPHRLTITAHGSLTAATAHLLSKTVVGALRRYPTPVLAIDLSEVTSIDPIGEAALRDCDYEAQRRGILLTLLHAKREAPRRSWVRAYPTGTICRRALQSR
ncbi:STAS domain-containing protein [Allorhizocola rhizosphaerae]|uniref:STAS domain-containing protein n=1 Tax=Allorhizocola rhizosphaerae TaxID=1872709 RepID=UPI000E3BFFA4|nr:STAS domain-containing protein [Allorhizocola rhizosphaerae]